MDSTENTTMQTPPQSTPPYTAPPAGPGPAPAGPYNGPLALQFNTGRKFALLKEKSFLRKDIPDLFPSTGDPAVAVVRENPSDPNVIGLTNCSRSIWTAAMPDGSQRSVDAGKSIKLVPGMVITFGNNNQAQVVPLSSGSAFIAQYGKLMGIGAAALVVVVVLIVALTRGGGGTSTAAVADAKKAVFFIFNKADQGEGSGFFIDNQGHALTNNHVTGSAQIVRVQLADGQALDAKVLKTDPALDVSLLEIPTKGNPYLEMSSAYDLKAGQDLWTIGYPLGDAVSYTDSSVSKGVFSGLRDAKTAFADIPTQPKGSQLVQTDAEINHGNSGGAIVINDGHVVAISRLIRRELPGQNSTQAVTGLNFGIPIDEVRKTFLPGTAVDSLAIK